VHHACRPTFRRRLWHRWRVPSWPWGHARQESKTLRGELQAAQARVRVLEEERSTLRSERDLFLDQISAAHAQLNALGAALDQVELNSPPLKGLESRHLESRAKGAARLDP
jgi:uncharacterized coiled-coil DUF342 family protein